MNDNNMPSNSTQNKSDEYKESAASSSFDEFYVECFNKAFNKAAREYNYRREIPGNYESSYIINHQIEILNKVFESVVEEMTPKLHRYFRLKDSHELRWFDAVILIKILEDSDDSVPFNGKAVYVPFLFCGSTMNYKVDRFFRDYYEDDDRVVLQTNLQKLSYKPFMSEKFDEGLLQLSDEEKRIKQKIKCCNDHLTETQKVLAELKENRLMAAIGSGILYILVLCTALLFILGVRFVCGLISKLFAGIELGFISLFAKIIVGLIVAAVVIWYLIVLWKEIISSEFEKRKKAQEDVKQAEQEIAAAEKELSDYYHKEKERGAMIDESESDLAEKWLDRIYRRCHVNFRYLISENSVNYKK